MGELYVYDASTHLTTVTDGSVELTEVADQGQVGDGHVDIEDSAGTLSLTGHKAFRVEQSDCSTVTVFRGYVGPRDIQRDSEKGLLVTNARVQRVTLVDLNARLGFHRIFGTSWIRPAETISARLTALLASSFLSSLVADNGFVDYPTTNLDKTDCRGMTPGDVLADMAVRVGYNHFVYWDEAAGEAALWFRDSNTSTAWSSTLRISNVASEVDSTTTFAPSMDTVLHRDPSLVVSKVGVPFKNGYVIRSRAATETTYQARDGIAPSANIRKWAKAAALGDQYLYVHRSEEDRITTRLLDVPSSKVNLIRAGQRIQAKFSEFTTEGYGSAFTWFRVLKRTVVPLTADGLLYEIRLDLSPQEPVCQQASFVQMDYYDEQAQFPPNYTERYSFPTATQSGNLAVVGVLSNQAQSGLVGEAPTGWNWALQNEDVGSNLANFFWKESTGDSYVDVRFTATGGSKRILVAEYSGLTSPSLYAPVTWALNTSNPGYTIQPATAYPSGPALVLAFGFMDDGPGAPDDLAWTGTGGTLRSTIPAGLHGAGEVALADMATAVDAASGTTPLFPAAGGWRFLFVAGHWIAMNAVFVGECE